MEHSQMNEKENEEEISSNIGEETEEIEKEIEEQFSTLEKVVISFMDKIPQKLAPRLKADINFLRDISKNRDLVRIALVGRRGAGKSSLINALIGDKVRESNPVEAQTGPAKWEPIPGKKWEIMDTRGCQDGGIGTMEQDPSRSALDSFKTGILTSGKWPDAVFFVLKATEVDSAILGDLNFLSEVSDFLNRPRKNGKIQEVPIFAVMTWCDVLQPKILPRNPPQTNREKEKISNLEKAKARLLEIVLKCNKPLKLEGVYPVSTYVEWDEHKADPQNKDYDQRWGLDEFAQDVQSQIRIEAQFNFARGVCLASVKAKFGRIVVGVFSSICATIGVTPIPIADMAIITPLQALMIYIIKLLSPSDLRGLSMSGFFGAMGVTGLFALGAREGFRQLVKLIPGAGSFLGFAIAGAGTWFLGEMAIQYFIHGMTKFNQMLISSKKKEAEIEMEKLHSEN